MGGEDDVVEGNKSSSRSAVLARRREVDVRLGIGTALERGVCEWLRARLG